MEKVLIVLSVAVTVLAVKEVCLGLRYFLRKLSAFIAVRQNKSCIEREKKKSLEYVESIVRHLFMHNLRFTWETDNLLKVDVFKDEITTDSFISVLKEVLPSYCQLEIHEDN